jgi:NAD(P)-dependent dehydrogenase (short-subunit alcohol dehydrogenase family)
MAAPPPPVVSGQRRTAIVTGAGSGLGRATATVFAESGTDCVLVGRRSEPLLETAAAPGLVGDTLVVSADVTAAADRKRIVRETLERFGRIDILVNNAGVSGQAPLLTYPEDEWRRIMVTNVDACFFMAQAVLPPMRAAAYGRIVNITSLYTHRGLNPGLYPGFFEDDPVHGPIRQPAYHVSKGALITMTRELAGDVAQWGVTVNAVSPGAFLTKQSEGIVDDRVIEAISARTPMGRWGAPRELAYAVRFHRLGGGELRDGRGPAGGRRLGKLVSERCVQSS